MKKLLAILLAAASALSICAFTACDKDGEKASDEVTQAEWLSAISSSKFLNVTVNYKYTSSYTDADGTTGTYEGNADIKNDFALNSNYYLTGSGYWYSEDSDNSTSTCYESFTSSSYYYIEKYTEIGEEDEWYGYKYSSAGTVSDSDNISYTYGPVSNLIDEYSNFEYVDGSYKYVETNEYNGSNYYESLNNTFYIKINDGYVTSFIWEENDYLYETSTRTTYSSYSREEYTFSNYGTTSVTIPEEYTYEYYSENYA